MICHGKLVIRQSASLARQKRVGEFQVTSRRTGTVFSFRDAAEYLGLELYASTSVWFAWDYKSSLFSYMLTDSYLRTGRGGIVHFEISPKNMNKVVKATETVYGDVTENMESLLPLLKSSPRQEWLDQINSWKKDFPFCYPEAPPGHIRPQVHKSLGFYLVCCCVFSYLVQSH
jgi:hypothetical protein